MCNFTAYHGQATHYDAWAKKKRCAVCLCTKMHNIGSLTGIWGVWPGAQKCISLNRVTKFESIHPLQRASSGTQSSQISALHGLQWMDKGAEKFRCWCIFFTSLLCHPEPWALVLSGCRDDENFLHTGSLKYSYRVYYSRVSCAHGVSEDQHKHENLKISIKYRK